MRTGTSKDSRLATRFKLPNARIECSRGGSFLFRSKSVEVVLDDLSSLGIRLYTREEVERGERIRGKLFLPPAIEPVKFAGKVRWARKTSRPATFFAIAFDKISDKDKERLLKFARVRINA